MGSGMLGVRCSRFTVPDFRLDLRFGRVSYVDSLHLPGTRSAFAIAVLLVSMGCQVTTVRRGRCLEQTVQVLFIPAWDLGLVVGYVIRHESNDELASRTVGVLCRMSILTDCSLLLLISSAEKPRHLFGCRAHGFIGCVDTSSRHARNDQSNCFFALLCKICPGHRTGQVRPLVPRWVW